jgi:tRNA(Ile2) C34 agmatinyltransferase TiaS
MQLICPECGRLMKSVVPDCWTCPKCGVNVEQLNIFEGSESVESGEKELLAM